MQPESGEQFNGLLDIRLVTVNVVDSHYANDPAKFISVVLNSLVSMLHMETPFINVLSKVDIIEQYGETDFNIDFYCELPDLSLLVDRISDDPFLSKFKKLTEGLASIIESYGLVSYMPLSIHDKDLLVKILNSVDQANGYLVSNLNSVQDVRNSYRSTQADFQASKYGNLL